LSEVEREAVAEEIRARLDWYADAVMRLDIDAMLTFWSESAEFTFAGDGTILGGYEEWAPTTMGHIAETKEWLAWNWNTVHVVPLSKEGATATVEFDASWINLQGDTLSLAGSWTYVFKKAGGVWKVVQTNGTHVWPEAPPDTGDEEAVWALEEAYFSFVQAGDVENYLNLWHDDFVGWQCRDAEPGGKDAIDDWVQAIADQDIRVEYELDRKSVRSFGNLVVTHYGVSVDYYYPDGSSEAILDGDKIMHTWQRSGDSWKIVTGMCAAIF
jgi:ketosteroid isomerase-like protein